MQLHNTNRRRTTHRHIPTGVVSTGAEAIYF